MNHILIYLMCQRKCVIYAGNILLSEEYMSFTLIVKKEIIEQLKPQ